VVPRWSWPPAGPASRRACGRFFFMRKNPPPRESPRRSGQERFSFNLETRRQFGLRKHLRNPPAQSQCRGIVPLAIPIHRPGDRVMMEFAGPYSSHREPGFAPDALRRRIRETGGSAHRFAAGATNAWPSAHREREPVRHRCRPGFNGLVRRPGVFGAHDARHRPQKESVCPRECTLQSSDPLIVTLRNVIQGTFMK